MKHAPGIVRRPPFRFVRGARIAAPARMSGGRQGLAIRRAVHRNNSARQAILLGLRRAPLPLARRLGAGKPSEARPRRAFFVCTVSA
jgi:hypothetical protein